MTQRRIRCSITLCIMLCLTASAQAGEPETNADRESALELSREGKAHYRAGRFARAVELLERAYRAYPEPVLQFNLAKAYEGLGDFSRAVDAYERYLMTARDIEDRPAIEARMRSLERELEERHALERQRDAARERAKRAKGKTHVVVKRVTEPSSPWPWLTTAIGATGAVTGVVLWAVAKNNYASAKDASGKDARERVDTAQSLAKWGNVLVVSGSVVAASGLTWLVWSSNRSHRSAALQLTTSSMEVVGRF